MSLQKVWTEANRYRGCLTHLKTTTPHRQHSSDGNEPLLMYDPFRSDEAKLLSSKAFRVLHLKTQVLTAPDNPFIRNRATHVLEVQADSVVVADILGLNVELVRAIALGHDIGHVPFGHPGESFLAKAMGRKFCHEIMGPFVAQHIERKDGRGLNLTFETLDGMMRHSGDFAKEDMSQEAWLNRFMDKVAYLTADYHDIERMGYPIPHSLQQLMGLFGSTHRERTSTMMAALIIESAAEGKISFEKSAWAKRFQDLRSAMMEIYPRLTQQNFEAQLNPVLEFLHAVKIGNPFLLFALLTDQDVIRLSSRKTLDVHHLKDTAIGERLEFLANLPLLDICCPYLDWYAST